MVLVISGSSTAGEVSRQGSWFMAAQLGVKSLWFRFTVSPLELGAQKTKKDLTDLTLWLEAPV